jgi:signal transduction histidine kinase
MSPKPFQGQSLKDQLTRYWGVLAVASVGLVVLLGVSVLKIDQHYQSSRVLDDLRSKATGVARRVSAELLLGDKGAPDSVIETLRTELQINRIELLPVELSCEKNRQHPTCIVYRAAYLWTEIPVPYIGENRMVILAQNRVSRPLADYFPLLLVSALPLLALLGAGLFMQWRFLNRQILEPIGVLLDTGGAIHEPASWPQELKSLSEKLRKLLEERDRAMKDAQVHRAKTALADLSERILHDLKSPIGTLDLMLETDLKSAPAETKDSFRRVLGRIHGIINLNFKQYSPESIVAANDSPEDQCKPAPCSLLGVTSTIVEEEKKKAAERGVQLIADLPKSALDAFVPLSFSELGRVISNLVGNAIDAAEQGEKRVYLSLSATKGAVELVIRDYGRGFDAETLAAIEAGDRKTTKPSGSGLGLRTAHAVISQAQGKLTIQSASDGATVRIVLPRIDPPEWFFDITRSHASSVVSLDDDATIAKKLERVFSGREVRFTQSEEGFFDETSTKPDALLLVDYDFGGKQNGIDLIVGHGLTRQAVLVSGRISFDPAIRAQAERHGIRLFPKECLGC